MPRNQRGASITEIIAKDRSRENRKNNQKLVAEIAMCGFTARG
jgi:hypothetical protein